MTQEVLKQLLIYDEATGDFFHRNIRQGITSTSDRAGTLDNGYVKIGVSGKRYRAHRLVWLYVYGELPTLSIGHINHDRSDNRVSNLRLVSNSGNAQNMSKYKTNRSGITGVHWDKNRKSWEVQISVEGKNKFIGRFGDLDRAISERLSAELKYGYHINHGI